MTRLSAVLMLLALAPWCQADDQVVEDVYGRADVTAMALADTGEFYAMTRLRSGRESLEARLVLGDVMHFAVTPERGRIVDFRLLPQRRLAWVLRDGNGADARDTLWLAHLSTRSTREVLTAPSIRFTEIVPADAFGFELLVDAPGRRPKTELRRIEYAKGKGKVVARFRGRCDLVPAAGGALDHADCLQADGSREHLVLAGDKPRWRPLELAGLTAQHRLVGRFADGGLVVEEMPASGGSRILKLKDGALEELSASQSQAPTRYLRGFDRRSIFGALWLAGEPNAEILDPAHPDVSRYLQWSIRHSGQIIEVLGRSADQRMALVALSAADQPRRYELWFRDEEKPRLVGRSLIESQAPALARDARQVAMRDDRLHDVFVTRGVAGQKRLAVLMAPGTPEWGYAPFALSMAAQGFDVVESGLPVGTPPKLAAEQLVDVLKWARNMAYGGDGTACLVAPADVLEAVQPILYALATECLVALPSGQFPAVAADAKPVIRLAATLGRTEARL